VISPTVLQLSEKEQKYCLIIIETSILLITALLTLGALIGAVLQQVSYVYIFIGYMFEYSILFIGSALLGVIALYMGTKSTRTFNIIDIASIFFISGLFSFGWLFWLAKNYETITQGWHYIMSFEGLLWRLGVSLLLAFLVVSIIKKIQLKSHPLENE